MAARTHPACLSPEVRDERSPLLVTSHPHHPTVSPFRRLSDPAAMASVAGEAAQRRRRGLKTLVATRVEMRDGKVHKVCRLVKKCFVLFFLHFLVDTKWLK